MKPKSLVVIGASLGLIGAICGCIGAVLAFNEHRLLSAVVIASSLGSSVMCFILVKNTKM